MDAEGHASERPLQISEDVIYLGIAVLLVAVALVVLVDAAHGMLSLAHTDAMAVVLGVLDRLLLVFIIVELLYAVRVTLRRRRILAEPFLVVGILSAIKEIILLSIKAAEAPGSGSTFNDSMIEVGVLGVLVVLLALSAWLMRAKEHAPGEGSGDS
ncbi:MAG: phosphate-starvation-inducible PsiE family protein [Actinomycetes bacterium]